MTKVKNIVKIKKSKFKSEVLKEYEIDEPLESSRTKFFYEGEEYAVSGMTRYDFSEEGVTKTYTLVPYDEACLI